jgi:tetratricopeptide (TPR) repeat protein
VLADAEHRGNRSTLRVQFADESLRMATRADSNASFAALFDLTRDAQRRPEERLATARRLWIAAQATGREAEWAPRLAQALRDVPGERWGPDLVLALVRALQRTGAAAEARALIAANPALERRLPDLALERAASLAREGRLAEARPLVDSLAGVWAPARFLRAEFEFFAGELDSALVHYNAIAERSDDPDAATALDRMYLIEESPRARVRPMLGAIAYERWRGRTTAALALADSLWRLQGPRGEYAAHAALEAATLRLESGDARGALAPLLVVCDSLPDDRLAPVARQRAGDAYAALGDTRNALLQYEECLARYPRAWNSAEVRRRVERLRREKRL